MLHSLKKRLYFFVASYFAFWAKLVLRRWHPKIIVITGSSGKTTLLHMIEAQLGNEAVYSHYANSAIGIPFHVLGLPPNVPNKLAWFKYFLVAPFHILRKAPKQKLYVVEADCDRPKEGAFISKFLKPEAVLWVSVSKTHSMNFDKLVKNGTFTDHEQAIAYEFGNFVEAASKLVVVNSDYKAIEEQLSRILDGVQVKKASILDIDDYELATDSTKFEIKGTKITIPGIHPKGAGVSLQMTIELLNYLDIKPNHKLSKLSMPPGRNNLMAGKKGTIIIDSTYNTGLGATAVVLDLLNHHQSKQKWLIVGDILEQGSIERDEHEQLAKLIAKTRLDRVILLGKRNKAYTLPILQKVLPKLPLASFENPKEVLDYINKNLKGGETLLFKGAQGLEGVIEQLLANPADEKQLVRRGSSWTKRRQAWGLPK